MPKEEKKGGSRMGPHIYTVPSGHNTLKPNCEVSSVGPTPPLSTSNKPSQTTNRLPTIKEGRGNTEPNSTKKKEADVLPHALGNPYGTMRAWGGRFP